MMNNISVAGYSVHGLLAEGRIDIFGYLEACRYRYDLRTADIWNGLLPTLNNTDDSFLQKVRQGLAERELTLVNYHVDGCHVWEDEPEARARNRQTALQHLRAAAILGAKTVRIDTGGKKVVALSDEQLDILVTTYREYCVYGQAHGMAVGPETHWGFSLRADNMERIAQAVDHPNYGILLHIGHWEDGDPDAGDRRLARYTVHTHVDANVSRTNLAEKVDMLLQAGYTGCFGVEHHSAQNEYAEIAVQLAQVRRVLQERQLRQVPAPIAGVGETENPLLTPAQENET